VRPLAANLDEPAKVLMARQYSKYRNAALLSGLIVLGWLWDLALGGGRAHAAAWLGALIVVGGISLLAARGAARPEPPATTAPAPSQQVVIEPATAQDLPQLIEVEVAADTLFEVAGYGSTPGPASIEELASARLLLVARRQPSPQPQDHSAGQPADPPIGYVRVELVDDQPHLEGLSVRPKEMRHGIGTALVHAACQWATQQGFSQITLCTFADVPWNGPFYTRLGFTEIPAPSPALRALRQREVQLGLDGMGRRCVMRKPLTREPAGSPQLPTG
jgi:ribosomal protein S18 acetylase RimI-like enzyme